MLVLVSVRWRSLPPAIIDVLLTTDENTARRAAYRFCYGGDPEGTPAEQAATVEGATELPGTNAPIRINVEGVRV